MEDVFIKEFTQYGAIGAICVFFMIKDIKDTKRRDEKDVKRDDKITDHEIRITRLEDKVKGDK